MVMRILGVHLVSEGQGMSVDDNVAESQFTFVAHAVDMWKPLSDELSPGQTTSFTSLNNHLGTSVVG